MIKKQIIIVVTLLFAMVQLSKAQVQFYTQDSTSKANFYIGYLGGSGVEKDLSSQWFSTTRIGAKLQWDVSKKFFIQGFGVVDSDGTSFTGVSTFGTSFISYSPKEWFTIQGGNLGSSLTNNFRPHPVSSSGQFESTSQALLPGADLGIKSIVTIGSIVFETNVMKREDEEEYQFVIGNRIYKSGFFYSESQVGGVFKYQTSNFYFLLTDYVSTVDNTSSNKLGIGISWTFNAQKTLSVFGDFSFDDTTSEWVEVGLGKNMVFGKFKGSYTLSVLYSEVVPSQARIAFMVNL